MTSQYGTKTEATKAVSASDLDKSKGLNTSGTSLKKRSCVQQWCAVATDNPDVTTGYMARLNVGIAL
jgi:hypothetical protein